VVGKGRRGKGARIAISLPCNRGEEFGGEKGGMKRKPIVQFYHRGEGKEEEEDVEGRGGKKNMTLLLFFLTMY